MGTNFPTALDTLSNPAGTDLMNTGAGHHQQHTDANDCIEAVEGVIGVGAAVTGTGENQGATTLRARAKWAPRYAYQLQVFLDGSLAATNNFFGNTGILMGYPTTLRAWMIAGSGGSGGNNTISLKKADIFGGTTNIVSTNMGGISVSPGYPTPVGFTAFSLAAGDFLWFAVSNVGTTLASNLNIVILGSYEA